MPIQPHPCVAIVPSGAIIDRRFEEALAELNRRGYPVRRVRQADPPPNFRDQLAAAALAEGFLDLLWLDPSVVFDPSDVERLRLGNAPMVCGVYPWPGRQGLVCEFTSEMTSVQFGRGGGRMPVVSCGLGFSLIRRHVFEAITKQSPAISPTPYFATTVNAACDSTAIRAAEDVSFCKRVRSVGFEIVADTSIRLWRVGPATLGWEDAGGGRERLDDFTLHIHPQTAQKVAAPIKPVQSEAAHPEPPRNGLRGPATTLREDFPRIGMYVVTYGANAESLNPTLASIRESDWGSEPVVVMQPTDWPVSRDNGSRNYKRALEAAAADGCDFAFILEDDVLVNRHLRHNLLASPLVQRDQCDYFSLFIPDLIAEPWERFEPHLGYRLARPRYSGPNQLWERSRVYGTQGVLLSRRFVLAALERWDRLVEGQDTRVISVCAEFRLPLWYSVPCLVEHVPRISAFGTPMAYAPDFDADFRLEIEEGFQPPEEVPGWLTLAEARLLWKTAMCLEVLELGTACGRSTVCLGQSAKRVVSVDIADQAEAAEWARRFGVSDRVEFLRDHAGAVCQKLSGKFDLVFIDTLHDSASVERDIAIALRFLKPDGLLAFHDYPDPSWPDVRRIVDEHAKRLGWKRRAQADFLGVFGAAGFEELTDR